MASDQFDYAAIIADLEAKKSLLEAAIASLRAAMAGGSVGLSDGTSFAVSGMATGAQGGEVPDGAFLGKSVRTAMKLYLSIVAKKQTTREIADGLKKGGLESTSKFFEKIVYATLDRLRKAGEFVKIGDSWGLPEWYPAHIRAGLSQSGGHRKVAKKQPSLKGRLKAAKDARAKSQPKLLNPAREDIFSRPLEPASGPQATIEKFFSGHLNEEFSSKEVAQHLNIKPQAVGLVAAKLVHKGWLEKTNSGKFVRVHRATREA